MTLFDAALADFTIQQLGLVTLDQFSGLGGTEKMLRTRAGDGRLVPLAPRVYAIGGTPPTWRQRLLAGLLSLGPTAAISHSAAAALFAFDGFAEGSVEFTVPARTRRSTPFATIHTSTKTELIDLTTVDEFFRCTSASRTIIDLAASGIGAGLLGKAIDSAVRTGRSSPAFLAARLAALRGSGVAGVRLIDSLLVDSGGHSPLERRFLRLMRESGLPRPSVQVIHRDADDKTFARVDFQFTPIPFVVEVSGRLGHVTDSERGRDAHRRNELQSAGFVVLEFTRADVYERPHDVARAVRRELDRQSARSM